MTEAAADGQVLFIAPKKVDGLPHGVHGMPQPSSSPMESVRFLCVEVVLVVFSSVFVQGGCFCDRSSSCSLSSLSPFSSLLFVVVVLPCVFIGGLFIVYFFYFSYILFLLFILILVICLFLLFLLYSIPSIYTYIFFMVILFITVLYIFYDISSFSIIFCFFYFLLLFIVYVILIF